MERYLLYSKPGCAFCQRAELLLQAKGAQFDIIVLDVGQPKEDGVQYISREELLNLFPGARTMPQVGKVVDGIFTVIGGYQELQNELGE